MASMVVLVLCKEESGFKWRAQVNPGLNMRVPTNVAQHSLHFEKEVNMFKSAECGYEWLEVSTA